MGRPSGVLISLAQLSGLTGPPAATVWRRPLDGGRRGVHKVLWLVRNATLLAWRARRFETVVVVTAGIELFVLAALLPKGRVVAADWLIPASRRLDTAWPLSRVRRFVVIRRADVATLSRRFSVPVERCTFVPFPAPVVPEAELAKSGDDGYVYSAGRAHRDWPTLVEALRIADVDALLSVEKKFPAPPKVRVVTQLTVGDGRGWMQRSRLVALAFVDTELPSGPLVLLDAMAHGKAVITSDVGGTRDYVTDGVNAILVPPGDPQALAVAVTTVTTDDELRTALGRAALSSSLAWREVDFWDGVLAP